MKKIFKASVISAAFVCFFLLTQPTISAQTKASPEEETPTKAIQHLDKMLDQFHIGTLTHKQEEENHELKRKIIRGTFNINELAKLALAGHWEKITKEEQENFVKLLTDLLEEKALFSKEQVGVKNKAAKKYTVLYKGHKFLNPEKTLAFVTTKVVVPSENVTIGLNYKLKKDGDEWRIFDVIVDEASLVSNYKYQFNSIITKHGYPDLVRRMIEKLDEIKGKRNAANKSSEL